MDDSGLQANFTVAPVALGKQLCVFAVESMRSRLADAGGGLKVIHFGGEELIRLFVQWPPV